VKINWSKKNKMTTINKKIKIKVMRIRNKRVLKLTINPMTIKW